MKLPGWLKKNKNAREIGGEAIDAVLTAGGPITGRRVLKALLAAAVNVLLGRVAARKG